MNVRLSHFMALLLLAAVGLSACGQSATDVTDTVQDTTEQATDAAGTAVEGAKDAAGTAAEGAKDAAGNAVEGAQGLADKVTGLVAIKDNLSGLQGNVTNALDAVKAGDFETAKAEVATLKATWDEVSGTVQEQSPEAYEQVQTNLDAVDTSLAEESSDAAVEQLESINNAVKGLLPVG